MKGTGRVLWITGLSGSGKSTLAQALLPYIQGPKVLLDGDALREALGVSDIHFDIHGRKKLAQTYGNLAKLIANQGITVLVATISLFHDIHLWNRVHLPGYLEIFLDVPLEECRRRNPKGVYPTSTSIPTQPIAGVEIPVEFPLEPHLRLPPHGDSSIDLHMAVSLVLESLEENI